MTNEKKWTFIRIGAGGNEKEKTIPLFKEIVDCAKQFDAVSVIALESIDGFPVECALENGRLNGAIDRRRGLNIKVLLKSDSKNNFPDAVCDLSKSTKAPIGITATDSEVAVSGIE